MPSINLADLRMRTQELAGLLPDAPAFRAGVRALMETHAHRLLRRGKSMSKRGALQAWDVPGLLLRELESALRPAAIADPSSALKAADLLWPDGRLEERLIAARLASVGSDPDPMRIRISRWISGLEDPVVLREIAEETCRPLRLADSVHFQADVREWINTPSAAIRRFGWMALHAWLIDLSQESALAAFDLLPLALRETDPETIRLPIDIFLFLAQTHPAESQRWLNDLPPDLLRRGRSFFRAAKTRLPETFVLLLDERGA
jgi:hypothetical protein